MSQFKVGDVVTLKSGGPEMTVEFLGGAAEVKCVWHCEIGYGTGAYQQHSFQPETLTLAE